MEYYAAWKSKEILAHTAAWINFEDAMLSEIIQLQEDKHMYGWVPFLFTSNYHSIVNWLYTPIQNKKFKVGEGGRKRTNTIWFYLDEIPQEVKIIETESRMGLGLEEGGQEELFLMGIDFQMCNMKKLWRSILQSCKYT